MTVFAPCGLNKASFGADRWVKDGAGYAAIRRYRRNTQYNRS